MNNLYSKGRWIFRFYGYGIFLFISIFTFGFGIKTLDLFDISYLFFLPIYLMLIVIFSEIYARLAYNNWKYEFTKTNLKLERGIIWKRYSNVPYERVQNIDVHRGMLARIFGFSKISIQTAGYSYGSQSEGQIPAVSIKDAEKIRKFLIKKIN